MAQFEAATVRRFAGAEEIEIETRATPASKPTRTPVWVVVTGNGVYVRAVRGTKGKWYRSIRSDPDAAVILEGRHVRVRPVAVTAPAEVERVTEAYRDKYRDSPWLGGVLKPHTLEATLQLQPTK